MKSFRVLFPILLCALMATGPAVAEVQQGPVDQSGSQASVGGPSGRTSATPAIPSAEQTPDTPQGQTLIAPLAAAQSPLAVDGNLDIGTAPALVPFLVDYPSFGPEHKVTLRITGVTNYTTTTQTTSTTTPLIFTIPKAIIAPNFGNAIDVTYTVEVPGAPIQTSAPLIVNITLAQLLAPETPLAEDGKLDIGKAPLLVPFKVAYPSLSPAHKVMLTVEGTPPYKTAVQTTSDIAPLTFKVPREVLARELGKTLNITYTVEIDGVAAQTSTPVALDMTISGFPAPSLTLLEGVNVANKLNDRYSSTVSKCDAGKPAYYCSGVMIRGTQDGSFDPWNPSASAIALGGVSFSYMRKDAFVDELYRNSGFIVFAQQEALSRDKALDYLCVYAYDAWTALPDRPEAGCGFQPQTTQVPDPSTCSQVNATTQEGWYAFTSTLTRQQDQCSLSIQDPEQFLTSLKVRANRPENMPDAWNEILVKVWDQDIPWQLPLEAFFYKNPAGLAEAKAYQQKYATRTGGAWLPIIKLELSQLDNAPFSYNPADQAIQP